MRMRRVNFSRVALFKTTKNYHSIFIKMKISFCMIYPNIMNGNHTATDLKLFTSYPKLENPRWPIVAFLFLFSI